MLFCCDISEAENIFCLKQGIAVRQPFITKLVTMGEILTHVTSMVNDESSKRGKGTT